MVDNIKNFYWFSFFKESMFIIPIMVLFWQQNGLSLTEIMILQSLYALSTVAFEIPTGIVADKIGRKISLTIGAFVLVLGALIYGFGYSFFQFFVAEAIWALGGAFISGADSAFVYETLKEKKKHKDYKKVWGNVKSFGYLAAGLSAIAGGFIAVYSLRLNWFLVAGGILFASLITLNFKEPKHFKKLEKKSYWKHTFESFQEAIKNKEVLFLILFHSLLAAIAGISLWFYQPYMNQSGLNIMYFGIVWAGFSLFAITGAKSAHRLENKLGGTNSLWIIIFSMVLSLIFMSQFFVIFGFIFIFLQQFIRGFAPPIIQDYTNKHLSSNKRATILSIQNLSGRLMFAILAPLFGFFADKYTLSNALLITAISFFIVFSLLMLWGSKQNRR